MSKPLYQRLELIFWKTSVHAMNESHFVQVFIQKTSRLFIDKKLQFQLLSACVVSIAGFSSGLLGYLIIAQLVTP